jgi:hypothetical protein
MLPFLHYHPIAGTFHTFIFIPAKSPADAVARRNAFSWLARMGLIQQLIDLLHDLDILIDNEPMLSAKYTRLAKAISESLVRIVEEACRTEDSYLLFSSVSQDSLLVEPLMEVIKLF